MGLRAGPFKNSLGGGVKETSSRLGTTVRVNNFITESNVGGRVYSTVKM